MTRCLLRLITVLLAAQVLLAQDAPTVAEIEKRIDSLKASPDLDSARKDAAAGVYQQAIKLLRDAEAQAAQANDLEAAAKAAPGELTTTQAALAKPPLVVPEDLGRDMTLDQMQKAFEQARANETARKQALDELKGEPARREARRVDLVKLIAEEKKRLEELDRQLEQPAAADEPPELVAARRARLEATRYAVQQRARSFEAELANIAARSTVLEARVQLAQRDHTEAERLARAWKDVVDRRSRLEAQEAERRAQQAKKAAEDAHPVVRDLAARNADLAEQTTKITELKTEVSKTQDTAKARLREIEEKETEARKRIDAVGLTDAIGFLLRQHRARLPDPRDYRARADDRRSEIGRVQLARIGFEDEADKTTNVDATLERLIEESERPVSPDQLAGVRSRLRQLLADRKEQIDTFVRESDRYLASLVALDTTEQELIAASQEYAAFIDERVLWIRSTQPLWRADWSQLVGSLAWVVEPDGWAAVGTALATCAWREPVAVSVVLVALLLLLLARARVVKSVFALDTQSAKATSFVPTLKTLAASLLRALPAPAVVWAAGWVIGLGAAGVTFPKALGAALQSTAELYLTLSALRQLLAPGGLAEAHLGWRGATVQLVRRNITWFMAISIPARFTVAFYEMPAHEEWHVLTGRVGLIVLLLAMAVFSGRILRPAGGVLSPELRGSKVGWASRLRHVTFAVALGIPVALAVGALLGYHYTASELVHRLEATLGLVFALVVVNALVVRALVVARRRLAQKQQAEPVAASAPQARPAHDPSTLDLAAVDAQSRQLLWSGITLAGVLGAWLIWVDVLPALGILRQVDLWTHLVESTEQVVGEDGRATPVMVATSVTLADLLFVLLVVALTVLATKNIPGLLEVGLLQRLPIHSSSRYAVTTVARQIIVVVGIVIALNSLGLSWAKVQWLVAAMSVGLGFGLQEIFGNFISGLILLFERRIRVGDVVTVGDVSGAVSRVRVLATTIRNWDRKEFVVPNKDLITGRLLNWTLSDEVNRIVVTVGVAYGSDTVLARKLLLEIAHENPLVLDDPAPLATFEEFGDSSLNLLLRCFLPDLGHRLQVTTELHDAIDAAFKKAGIEIAFPQRDLHVRSAEPLRGLFGSRPQGPESPPPA